MTPPRFLRWCLVAFLVGIVFAHYAPLRVFDYYVLFLCGCIIALLCRKNNGIRYVAFMACALCVGSLRMALEPSVQHFVLPEQVPFTFSGTVVREPLIRGPYQIVTINTPEVLRVRVPLIPQIVEGDTLQGTCTRATSPSSSSLTGHVFPPLCLGSDAKSIRGQSFSLSRGLSDVRLFFQHTIDRGLPPPASDLLAGLLIGAQESFSDQLKNDFRTSGLSHIVAISGYNISIIIAGLWSLLRGVRLSRRAALSFLIVGTLLFVGITGASPPTVRAACMGLLVLMAQYTGRFAQSGHALLIAATAMVTWSPSLLLSSVGFQLSVLATAGLIIISPILTSYVKTVPSFFGIKDLCIQTVSACIATSPLILYVFHTFSLVAVPANLLVLPLVPFAMAIGFLWSVVAMISPFDWIGQVSALPVTFTMNTIIAIGLFFAHLPSAQVQLHESPLVAQGVSLVSALIIGVGVIVLRKRLRSAEGEGSIQP